MKIKSLLITFIIILTCSAGCISTGTDSGSWEGITGDTLRVTITEFFPYEDNDTDEIIKNKIIEKLNQRASLIMASHITMNLSRNKISRDVDVTINRLISESIAAGKMVNYECNENNYCSANGEYNILELQKNLESINNQ